MNKIKDTLMLTVVALAFLTLTGIAKADEKTYTPSETLKAVSEIPTKVVSHISNEITATKEYQAQSWAEMKAQWASLKTKFLSN